MLEKWQIRLSRRMLRFLNIRNFFEPCKRVYSSEFMTNPAASSKSNPLGINI